MKSIKVILAGITVILASLFFMGICIIRQGGPEGLTLGLFIAGVIICIIGFVFIKDDDANDDGDDYENDDHDE